MEIESNIIGQLGKTAGRLAGLIDGQIRTTEIKVGDLDELIQKAAAREHRRAAHNLRDARCYRVGSSFEPVGALDLDPTALAGWLASGNAGVLALAQIGLSNPGDSIPELLARLFRSRIGGELRALGVHARWMHRSVLYRQEVDEFRASPAFSKRGWRSKPPTANQLYLVDEIALARQIEKPKLTTRGDAFEYIEAAGGNPVFGREPELPDLAEALAEFVS